MPSLGGKVGRGSSLDPFYKDTNPSHEGRALKGPLLNAIILGARISYQLEGRRGEQMFSAVIMSTYYAVIEHLLCARPRPVKPSVTPSCRNRAHPGLCLP